MDATNLEDPMHYRIATINLWEDPRMKKQTMHPEDIEEIIMVEILAIGAIVMKTDSTLSEENPPISRLPEKRPDESEFEKTMREFVIAQKTLNDFVNNQFYNLKTKVEQGQKNHQAAIQDLETKFGRIFDHQSLRPTEKKLEARYAKFLDMIKEVRINVPLVDVLADMRNYGKFWKDLVRNKSKMEQIFAAFLTEECSAILQNKIPPKLGDPESFLIP
ncbi:hypothetical protein Tco_1020201 [Tanacetum coccineum]|uniref:Uncharacterized protein n=1 Tax=Tanacetum coccineum TaxID=301880 RepID=A0ABQ5FZC4_9ASTR